MENVVGIDQSLSKTGLVVVECAPTPDHPILLHHELIESPITVTGLENTLKRAEELGEQWPLILDDLWQKWKPYRIIHEIPTMSNALQRPESSLLAAYGLRLAARKLGIPFKAISANTAKKRLTGSGNASKAKMRERLKEEYPRFRRCGLDTNQYDALALVITDCYPKD